MDDDLILDEELELDEDEQHSEGEERLPEEDEAPPKQEPDEDESDGSESDVDRESIQARRREERRLKKQRAREREESHIRQIKAQNELITRLNARLDQIDRRNHGFDVANIDSQMTQLNNAYLNERERVVKGTTDGDGVMVADATDRMQQIRERFNQLQATKRAITAHQSTPQALDPRLVHNAEEWKSRHSWFDPSGKDLDSRTVMMIDDSLTAQGMDPTSQAYWDELSAQVKIRLPHRSERGIMGRRAPPVGGSSRGGRSSQGAAPAGYPLSKERIQALKDAGLYDDPKRRAAAIAQFKAYDAAHEE